MKILVISDKASDYLWGPGVKEGLKGIDLILSCGDLSPKYLSFLTTFSSYPVLYVHGNHDGRYAETPPEGCDCIDGKLVTVKGLRILGLGGSIRYNAESPHQYTQRQMRRRAQKLWLPIHKNGGFDILLTHAAAYGLDDESDWAHTGFEVFNELIDRWHPAYFIHGHSHMNYGMSNKRLKQYGQTQIINAYERYVFEIEDR